MKDTFFCQKQTINCKGRLIDLTYPKVMGIVNLTPDSFYDGGNLKSDLELLNQVEKLLLEGAHFIDVGAVSSRPGAEPVSTETELNRILPAIEKLIQRFPEALISVDTNRSLVAEKSCQIGASIINDISAGDFDEKMFDTIAKCRVPYIIMHTQGTPQNMQDNPTYSNVTLDVVKELSFKIKALKKLGVCDIIVDPGFGFGKTLEHNYQLLRELDQFKILGHPILAGISRKSMIYKTLNNKPQDALVGTIVANTIALQHGAKILRVHDVKAAVDTIAIQALTINT